MEQKVQTPRRRHLDFTFDSFRNVSSPEDKKNGRTVYAGQAPLSSVLNLPTEENVRSYLVEARGKQRRSYTSVHKAIRDTLVNVPENFTVLNSGIVIVAYDVKIDEKEKKLRLIEPSIINGSQTQGVLKDLAQDDLLPPDIHIKFEIIVTDDDDLIAEISIARNFQNDVMTVSIAGRLKQFDELEESIINSYPDKQLRKSESELPTDDIIDTEKLLQVITALVPHELWFKPGENDTPNKVYTYSMKSRCLKEFQNIYKIAHDPAHEEYSKYVELYRFYLDIAAEAYDLYNAWKKHQGFRGTRLGSIERDGKEIIDVPDGIVFPILASLSVFATKGKKGWKLNIPSEIDRKLISTAKTAYMEIANSNPQSMGKSKACYTSLLQITSIYKELVR